MSSQWVNLSETEPNNFGPKWIRILFEPTFILYGINTNIQFPWKHCRRGFITATVFSPPYTPSVLFRLTELLSLSLPSVESIINNFYCSVPDSCWMEEHSTMWILSGPVCISMLANVFFLVNIVRVLVTKLKSPGSCRYDPQNGSVGGAQPLNPVAELRNGDRAADIPARSSSWSVPSLASLRKAVRYRPQLFWLIYFQKNRRNWFH